MDVHAPCRKEIEQARTDLTQAKAIIQSQADRIAELEDDRQRLINQAGTCCDED